MKKVDFNEDWSFRKVGAERAAAVTLPHDAMLHEKRAPGNPSGAAGAYFEGGAYEYEKRFEVPLEWREKHIVFQFEGIYQTAVVYLNGQEAGRVYNGYNVTEITADPYLTYGEMNCIRVEVDNQNQPNSRWYSGAGIYRPVWLYVQERSGIELYGVRIKTVSYEPAKIEVSVTGKSGTPVITIMDGEKTVAKKRGQCVVIDVPDAVLWSDENPHLYQCKVELYENDKVLDTYAESFGIRMLEWSPRGLFVNGKETLLRGGCLHHDNGLLGACSYKEAEWRKIRIMKECGFNAVRSSHNICPPALLEACDEIGMYVIDETWDMWYRHKSKYDYAEFFREHYKDDIQTMVNKDYNHPSVIFYSIGNEVSEPASEEGLTIEKEMADYIHTLDDTRAVTAGFNLMILANAAKGQEMYDGEGGLNADSASEGMDMSKMDSTMFNQMTQQIGIGMNHSADSDEADRAVTPALELLDIAGYNYASGRYPLEGEKHPERIIYGSETFPHDIYSNWSMVKKYPYLIGDFMWTAWDYLGEAGVGTWSAHPDAMGFNNPYPWLLGGAGVINILGDPDGEAFYAKTVWGLSKKPVIAVRPVTMPDEKTIKSAWRGTNAFPSWSWKDCDGARAFVEVYASADSAELRINGVIKEKKKIEAYKAVFETVYEPGSVEVIVYDVDGNEAGRTRLDSAGGEITVRIEPETEIVSGGLTYINIDMCGENGIVECNADEPLEVTVEGGTLLAFGSANPRNEESYLAGRHTTYYGRAQAIVRTGDAEELKITVESRQGVIEKKFAIVAE